MKSVILNKLMRRFVVLMILSVALLYLIRPSQAAAFTCQDDCYATESACEDDCEMNALIVRYCIIQCQHDLNQCLGGCPQ